LYLQPEAVLRAGLVALPGQAVEVCLGRPHPGKPQAQPLDPAATKTAPPSATRAPFAAMRPSEAGGKGRLVPGVVRRLREDGWCEVDLGWGRAAVAEACIAPIRAAQVTPSWWKFWG